MNSKTRKWLSVTLGLASAVFAAGVQAQTGSVATINADSVLVLNGKKVFPIGFSPGPPTGGKTPGGNDALDELRSAGALLIRLSQSSDWDSQLVDAQMAALDWAAQHGMYCWVNLRETSKFAAGDTATETKLRGLVQTFRNHPGLGLWKNFDEAWWAGVSATDLKNGYDVIKQEDPNHPVVQTHAPRGTLADLQPYNAAADVLAMDIYPIGYPPGGHSLLANKEISMVGDWTDFLRQVGGGQKPCWMIEQIAWSGVTPPGKTLRFPTFAEERFMAYQAIIRGARGLMYFGGNNAATLNPQDAPLGWNWTFWSDVLKPVVRQLGTESLLADALVAPNSTLPILVSGATNVEFCVREAPPYLYLLACKREGTTVNVTFSGLPQGASKGELLYEAPRAVTASGGSFTDWFAPFEVHAYRFVISNTPPQQVTLYEPFDYPNVGGPVSSNTPANWTYGGSGANDLNVASGSLSYPGLAASVGNSVTNGAAGLGVRRLLGTNFNSGQLFFSALFRMNQLGYGGWNGASTIVGALTAPDNTSFRLQVLVKSNSPNGYIFGVQKSGTGATAVFDTNEHTAGETVLLIGKYDYTQSPERATLWINPDPAILGGAIEPSTGAVSVTSGTDGYVIDRFNMRQNTVASVPAAMRWDELRIGFSWGQVTPKLAAQSAIVDPARVSNGPFQFSYSGAGAAFDTVFASTNLIDWQVLGMGIEMSSGRFQFTDWGATNLARRFYQLRR